MSPQASESHTDSSEAWLQGFYLKQPDVSTFLLQIFYCLFWQVKIIAFFVALFSEHSNPQSCCDFLHIYNPTTLTKLFWIILKKEAYIPEILLSLTSFIPSQLNWNCPVSCTYSLQINTLMCRCAFLSDTHHMHEQQHNPPSTAHTQNHKHICPPTHKQLHEAMRPDVRTHTAARHTSQQNPWQIICCSYVKWIKPGSSKSSQLACRDNSQTATCSRATNQLCVFLSGWHCVCWCGSRHLRSRW